MRSPLETLLIMRPLQPYDVLPRLLLTSSRAVFTLTTWGNADPLCYCRNRGVHMSEEPILERFANLECCQVLISHLQRRPLFSPIRRQWAHERIQCKTGCPSIQDCLDNIRCEKRKSQ
jgi:hypothetical protein